jgi:hypothetical protein
MLYVSVKTFQVKKKKNWIVLILVPQAIAVKQMV